MPSVRLSEAELADLKARAEAAGLSIGGYVRLRCLEQPPEPAFDASITAVGTASLTGKRRLRP